MVKQIPKINFKLLCNGNRSSIEEKVEFDNLKIAVQKYGFLIIQNHSVAYEEIKNVFALYRVFFNQSIADKHRVDMSQTSSNRGWGPIKSERVNPDFQPDTKEVFDCGPNINIKHDFEYSPYYAKNIWPENIPLFRETIERFYNTCAKLSMEILKQIEDALGFSDNYFKDKFDLPMALLRCNYYPTQCNSFAGNALGVAPHTDYGCLTLLFTDGTPGLEVELPSKKWGRINVNKNEIIVNFGEMLEIWSKRQIKATKHRVIRGSGERFSIPFFFNPQYDTVISNEPKVLAGDYLSARYNQTYLHKT